MAPGNPVRVAILTPQLPPRAGMGGIASSHFNLFRALAGAGWQVKAFAYLEAQDSESESEVRRAPPQTLIAAARLLCDAVLRVLSPSGRRYQLADGLSGAIAGLRMREPLARFRPDIIIVPDKGCPLAFVAKPPGARVVCISHNNPMRFLRDDAPPHSALDARLAVTLEARGLAKTDLVLCPSRDMREQFHRAYLFPGPVEVVPHLLSADVDAAGTATPPLREILRIDAAAPLFYLPAAGTAVKGGSFLAPLLAEIGRRHAAAGVFLSGTVESDFAAALADAPQNVRVFNPGALPYLENLARVRECDVALSPALFESFGMSLLEAAWLGVPVAAFAAGGIPDVIGAGEGGTNGETVPVGDISRLCDTGDRLLRELRSGELSRAQVAEYTRSRFSAAQSVARLSLLFQQLLDKPVEAPAR
jgi:glycosyltransferase involved in cell wall biosynthesis